MDKLLNIYFGRLWEDFKNFSEMYLFEILVF